MATEAAPSALNGTYHAHLHHHPTHYPTDPYNPAHAAATNSTSAAHFAPAHSTAPVHAHAHAGEPKNDITKHEVGWFFVEQYYTTLSRNPEKLHLFYSRKSQFVSGAEAEKVTVAVGQKAIHERIKELDFQDCKVRVLNVDSQASFDNIVVCVIGEISNKSEPPRRFVQTFILAEQPSGYYVLNDIIRYLVEDDEELLPDEIPAEDAEEAPVVLGAAAAGPTHKQAETTTTNNADVERQADTDAAAHEVDEKLEEATTNGEAKGTVDNKPQADEKTDAQVPADQAPVPVIPASADAVQPEKPKEPEPSPVVPSPPSKAAAAATPADKENVPPPKAAAPMSWASIASVASGRPASSSAPVPTPAPAATTTAPQAPQPKTAPTPQQPAAVPVPATANATAATAAAPNEAEKAPSRSSSSNGEWQTADHNRRQARQPPVAPADDNTLAFIKNVNEKVDSGLLRQTLQRFGKVKYYNVNRQQACAFVEFADPAGYKAAVAANPHQIGTERLNVEERRPRGNAYGGGPGRGGSGRGRGDRMGGQGGQGRGGFAKDAGRFPTRGRGGGNIAPRGRGQPQAS